MRILNIGCGNDTYGTDFVDLYPSRSEVLKCDIDIDKLPYPDETFDEVFSQGNFEHLTDPANYMKEAYRVLKKGGILILITDNASYLPIHIKFGLAYDHNYGSVYGSEDKHFAIFTKSHLMNWAEKFGFETIWINYRKYKYNNGGIKNLLRELFFMLIPERFSSLHIVLKAEKPGKNRIQE